MFCEELDVRTECNIMPGQGIKRNGDVEWTHYPVYEKTSEGSYGTRIDGRKLYIYDI